MTKLGCDDVIVTHGGIRASTGDVFTENTNATVIENGIVRLKRDFPTDPSNNVDRWRNGAWEPVVDATYGDWTFWASPHHAAPSKVTILNASPDRAEVAYEWSAHDLAYGSPSCYLATHCGIVARDHDGGPIYGAGGAFKIIRKVAFYKVVRVDRCHAGYYVGMRSVPALTSANPDENSWGEREVGIGRKAEAVVDSSGDALWYPRGNHGGGDFDHRWPASSNANGWVADIPYPSSDIHYSRFMAWQAPLRAVTTVWDAGQLGTTMVRYLNESTGVDGRPVRYQVYLGSVDRQDDNDLATLLVRVNAYLSRFIEWEPPSGER